MEEDNHSKNSTADQKLPKEMPEVEETNEGEVLKEGKGILMQKTGKLMLEEDHQGGGVLKPDEIETPQRLLEPEGIKMEESPEEEEEGPLAESDEKSEESPETEEGGNTDEETVLPENLRALMSVPRSAIIGKVKRKLEFPSSPSNDDDGGDDSLSKKLKVGAAAADDFNR